MGSRRKFLLALLALAVAILVRQRIQSYSSVVLTTPDLPRTTKAPYQAPFSNPNAPQNTEYPIIPGSYMIFLSPGHTLADHAAAVHFDITPFVYSTFDDLYPDRVVYLGQVINDTVLAAIRSDPGVEIIEYDTKVFMDDTSVYRAPLSNCDIPAEELLEGAYQILLAPDHSMEKHEKVVGREMVSAEGKVYKFHTGKTVYGVNGVGEELLAKVRSDPGVEMVVCEKKDQKGWR